MAGQITWRSILGESLTAAARPFELARQSFNDGFGALNRVLDQRNASAAEMAKQTQDTNQQNYLNMVEGAQTPEEVAALQPQLQAMRATLTPAAQAAVRNADELRTAAVMKQITDKRNFATAEQDAREAPIREQIGMLALKDPKAALAMLEANPGMRGRDVAMKAIINGERDATKWGWELTGQKHKEALMPLEIDSKKASIDASRAAVSASANSVAESQLRQEMLKDDRQRGIASARVAAEQQALRDTGNVYADGVYKPGDSEAVMKMMKDAGIGDDGTERQAVIQRIEKLAASSRNPLPLSVVKQAVLGSNDQMINLWGQGWANTVEKRLSDALKSEKIVNVDGKEVARNQIEFDLEQYLQNRRRAVENPATPGGKKR